MVSKWVVISPHLANQKQNFFQVYIGLLMPRTPATH